MQLQWRRLQRGRLQRRRLQRRRLQRRQLQRHCCSRCPGRPRTLPSGAAASAASSPDAVSAGVRDG